MTEEREALLAWRPEFALGIPGVDHEHRELIRLINEAWQTLRASGSLADVTARLGEILARISAHFALEERLMREAAYERYAEHKADHEDLLDELRELMETAAEPGQMGADELGRRLDRWFAGHFATHDRLLHQRIGHH